MIHIIVRSEVRDPRSDLANFYIQSTAEVLPFNTLLRLSYLCYVLLSRAISDFVVSSSSLLLHTEDTIKSP